MENPKLSIDKIFVFLTPFQVLAAKSVLGEEIFDSPKNLFIIHDRILLNEKVQNLFRFSDEFEFNKKEYINIFSLRKKLKRLDCFLETVLNKFQLTNGIFFYSGSDRDILCQMLILRLKDTFAAKVILIDEGTGFYVCNNFQDKILELLYDFFSFIFLKHKIQHVRPIGNNKYTNVIYVRSENQLCKKHPAKNYIEFKLRKETLNLPIDQGCNILVFTSPAIKKSVSEKIINQIILSSDKLNAKVFLKPHPREKDDDYYGFLANRNVQIISKYICGDQLPFSSFDLIINFKSSVIFEVLNSNFPGHNIITLHDSVSNMRNSIFDETLNVSIEMFSIKLMSELIQNVK